MEIEKIESQKIVDKLISLLGRNINIMNSEGIIIASGDTSRVNTFHPAAKIAIDQKKEVIIEETDIDNYNGCKPGVNLPIYFKNKIAGVVGITGAPAEMKGYGVIVKELVELMLQEDERKRTELFQQRAVTTFAREILKGSSDFDTLTYKSKVLNFATGIPRVVIVADICNFKDIISDYKEKYKSKDELMLQKLKQEIEDVVKSLLNAEFDLIFNFSEDKYVIFKYIDKDTYDFCEQLGEFIYSKFGIKFYIGIGSVCNSIGDYYKSYILANRLVNIGRKIHPGKYIYFEEHYKVHLLLKSVPAECKKEYVSAIFDALKSEKETTKKELFNTIRVYFECGMNVKEAAQKMFIHKNTIFYRINRYRDLSFQQVPR